MNFFWWVIEYSIGIYILLVILPEENLQKIFLYFSHYVQGATIFMLFLNLAIMLETLIVWVEKLDFSNVFQNDYEMTLRGLSGFEFW